MAKTRALMTDTERERLAGLADVEQIKVYQAKSRVRRRIEEELTFDVEILEERHPDLLDEIREVVCEGETEDNTPATGTPTESSERRREDTRLSGGREGGVEAAVQEVGFPSTKDRAECVAAVEAAYVHLLAEGTATMREFVREVMPEHPIGYDVPELEPGERYRGAWWRKVVKPGLEALPDVEAPSSGASEWKFVGNAE